jgi:ABC-type sugar transport system permease subunit
MSIIETADRRRDGYIGELLAVYRETWLGYLFVLPAIVMVSVIILYPTVVGIYTSFLEKSLLYPDEAEWVFIQNYVQAFNDPVFRGAFFRSILLTALAVSLEYIFGLGLALALKQKVPGIGVFRSFSMVPWVLPTVVMVTIFNFMFQPSFGTVNNILSLFGLPTKYWFGDPLLAFPLIVFLHVWRNAPFFAISLMAGMMAIPEEMYEAAQMDGAGAVQQFRHVTLPNISQVSMIMIVLHVIYTFNNFDIIFLSTGGGPLNNTEVLATYVYKTAFMQNALGYGAAIGTVMLILMLIFTTVYIQIEEVE